MAIIANLLVFLAAGASILFFLRARSLAGAMPWMPKALAGSISPFLVCIGALGAALGALYDVERFLALMAQDEIRTK